MIFLSFYFVLPSYSLPLTPPLNPGMPPPVRRYLDNQIDEIELKNVRQIQAVFSAFKDVVTKMEAETEERLKEKYVMVPRGDNEAAAGETELRKGREREQKCIRRVRRGGRGIGLGVTSCH